MNANGAHKTFYYLAQRYGLFLKVPNFFMEIRKDGLTTYTVTDGSCRQ
jgi:hypothetical protein